MASFTKEQMEKQIQLQLKSNGIAESVARSAANQAVKHYIPGPNVKINKWLDLAKQHIKTLKHMPDAPARKSGKGRR